MSAKCPNPICDGFDYGYFIDDITHNKCDKCGTTWDSYDPEERVENCFNIKIIKENK
jgi:hypothetical protein